MTHLRSIGFWSSISSIVFALAYSIPQILSEAKIIPHPHDLYWLFAPSLLLAPSFLIAMICLHYKAAASSRLFTFIGLAFAILYCADVTMVYFTQLTVVLPLQVKNKVNGNRVLLFDRRTFLMAVDCLGYFFMSLSTLFASFAFRFEKSKWLYRSLLYNGLLLPVLILAFFYPIFYYIGALWMLTFPFAMMNAAALFYSGSQLLFKIKLRHEH